MPSRPVLSGDGWRVADSFRHGDPDVKLPSCVAKYAAQSLSFENWGQPPPTDAECEWLPKGLPAFDRAIRFTDGLELRIKLYGQVFVANFHRRTKGLAISACCPLLGYSAAFDLIRHAMYQSCSHTGSVTFPCLQGFVFCPWEERRRLQMLLYTTKSGPQ